MLKLITDKHEASRVQLSFLFWEIRVHFGKKT